MLLPPPTPHLPACSAAAYWPRRQHGQPEQCNGDPCTGAGPPAQLRLAHGGLQGKPCVSRMAGHASLLAVGCLLRCGWMEVLKAPACELPAAARRLLHPAPRRPARSTPTSRAQLCTRYPLQECVAGSIMGGGLGLLILAFSSVWSGLDAQVGLTVAVALPVSCTPVDCCADHCAGMAGFGCSAAQAVEAWRSRCWGGAVLACMSLLLAAGEGSSHASHAADEAGRHAVLPCGSSLSL